MIDKSKLIEWRRLCDAATPLCAHREEDSSGVIYYRVMGREDQCIALMSTCNTSPRRYAEMFAAMPALLAAHEALREEIRAWRCEASTVHCAWTKRTKAESTKIMEQYVAECIQYHRENGCDDD